MIHTYFRFYSSLNDFLPEQRKFTRFGHNLKEAASIKDTIEAVGVPHPEVDLILVNGTSVGFAYLMQDGDQVSVYPRFQSLDIAPVSRVRPPSLTKARFVLDVHLGKLATYLRLLGFDGLYRNDFTDEELAILSNQENRILLTHDRSLLKRSLVVYGYWIRASNPVQQVIEVLQRFDLSSAIQPLSRCLRCNGRLEPVDKEKVRDRLPPRTQAHYDEFARCQSCDQLYWKGAHYEPMRQLIDRVLQGGEMA